MSAIVSPSITDVLVRLSRDHLLCKSRFDRRSEKHRKQIERFERQVRCLDRLNSVTVGGKSKRCKKSYAAKIDQVDAKAQREDDQYHLHPFPDVVAQIARWTGLRKERIHKATAAEFSGYTKVVDCLVRINEKNIQQLYQQLIKEHSTLAEKVGIKMTAEHTETERPKSRSGRKADYERWNREDKLAAEWGRTKDAPRQVRIYKAEFAHSRGYKLKDFDRLLNNVTQRKKRADNSL